MDLSFISVCWDHIYLFVNLNLVLLPLLRRLVSLLLGVEDVSLLLGRLLGLDPEGEEDFICGKGKCIRDSTQGKKLVLLIILNQ